MTHAVILGQTLSGKTTYAMKWAAYYRSHGVGVVVLDKYKNPEWCADWITSDPAEFMEFIKNPDKCLGCALFADEAGDSISRYDAESNWCTTQSRHFGHRFHLITQRAQMVSTTVRSQCSICVCFNVGPKDAKIYAEEFNNPLLLQAPELAQGEYIRVERFKPAIRARLW